MGEMDLTAALHAGMDQIHFAVLPVSAWGVFEKI